MILFLLRRQIMNQNRLGQVKSMVQMTLGIGVIQEKE